jgi:hypothetical protein
MPRPPGPYPVIARDPTPQPSSDAAERRVNKQLNAKYGPVKVALNHAAGAINAAQRLVPDNEQRERRAAINAFLADDPGPDELRT